MSKELPGTRRYAPMAPLTPAQQAFVKEHHKLGYFICHRFARRTGLKFDDMVGAAMIGLSKAAQTFDPDRGFKPSSYIVSKVNGELLHFARDSSYLLHIPHRAREIWMKGRSLLARGYSDRAISQASGCTLDQWLEARGACSGPPLSYNAETHDAIGQGDHSRYGYDALSESTGQWNWLRERASEVVDLGVSVEEGIELIVETAQASPALWHPLTLLRAS